MISPKKLIKMARKWQRQAISSRKRITLPNTYCSDAKGHFVVYTADETRFVLPLDYLKNDILRELLKMAEEEYGLPGDGPIMLPCDTAFLNYAVSLIQRNANDDLQRAFLKSITSERCSSYFYTQLGKSNAQLLVCSF